MVAHAITWFLKLVSRIKAAWEWWALLATLGLLPAATVMLGVFEGQPWSVLFLYATVFVAFVIVLIQEGGPLLEDMINRRSKRRLAETKRRELKGKLAAFANEGRAHLSTTSIQDEAVAYEWGEKVEAYLKIHDPALAARFTIGANLHLKLPDQITDEGHKRIWYHVQARMWHLSEFMKELRD